MAPITKSRRLTRQAGPINPYEPLQPEITATLVTLEAKKMLLNPPQTWGFQVKKDQGLWHGPHLQISRHRICPLGPLDP